MKRIRTVVSILSLIIIACACASAQNIKFKNLPKGDWTFSATPFSGKNWKSIPVDVYSVTTNMETGGIVETVGLRNWSDKTVTAVRIKWILSEGDKSVLSDGETRPLTVFIESGKTTRLNYPVADFSKISSPIAKNGRLSGNFRLEIVVTAIDFEDGSTWKSGDPAVDRGPTTNDEEGCAQQICLWLEASQTYTCLSQPNPGTFCAVGNGGNSCTVTRCPPGGDFAGQ